MRGDNRVRNHDAFSAPLCMLRTGSEAANIASPWTSARPRHSTLAHDTLPEIAGQGVSHANISIPTTPTRTLPRHTKQRQQSQPIWLYAGGIARHATRCPPAGKARERYELRQFIRILTTQRRSSPTEPLQFAGGAAWESNPPWTGLPPNTGFEDRAGHQTERRSPHTRF